jgi:hypothetical protein
MKQHFAFAAFLLLLGSLVFGQSATNRGLVLTGSVYDVKPENASRSEKKDQYEFVLELYLQFKNESDSPYIIFKPDNFYGEKRISFLTPLVSGTRSEDSTFSNVWTYPSTYDPFPGFVKELEAAEPAIFRFVIIEPGAYFECRETLRIKSGYRLEIKPNQKISEASPIPEFRAFTLEYYLSLSDRHEDYNPLTAARRKWKKLGQLILNSSGDYIVRSEIILNKLPN